MVRHVARRIPGHADGVGRLIESADKAWAAVRIPGPTRASSWACLRLGESVELAAVDIVRFDADGKVAEHWGLFDSWA